MVMRSLTLCTALGEAGRQFRDLLSRHCFAQTFARGGDLLCVIEMRDRIYYRAGALGGVAALEYSRAHEDAVDPQLHAEGSIGRRRDATGGEIDDRQSSELCDLEEERRRDAVFRRFILYFLQLLLFQKFL